MDCQGPVVENPRGEEHVSASNVTDIIKDDGQCLGHGIRMALLENYDCFTILGLTCTFLSSLFSQEFHCEGSLCPLSSCSRLSLLLDRLIKD